MKKLIILLALVGALSLVSISSAQFTSSQTWGSFGNGTGQFYGLSGVATDTSGNIYVAELDNRVQKFSGNGAYITPFNIPARNIAIDSSGNIYATVNDSIKKFNSAGTLLNTWGSTGAGNGAFNFPIGIALDSSGNIYVSDTENNRIQKLDSSGNYVTSWGTSGSGNGNLNSPAGIAVSGNNVYVADMGNYRIQKFDLSGNYVSSVGIQGTGNTQFNSSIAVANDPSGNIYVADYYNGRVIEYDSNFNYLTQYSGFSYPTALVIANSNLYVLDSGNYQVYKYYNNNNIQTILPVADFSTSVTSGSAPLSVLFTDLSQKAIGRSWDVNNDGIEDSKEASFVYVYTTAGTYTAKLTANNENGTDVKTATITVSVAEEEHHSSSSGGGGGGSPEPAKNVEVKELSQVFITNGKEVKFDFTKRATCVVYVSFDAKKTAGKITTIAEQLKGKSVLVSELPSGEVFKSFNLWVGNSGFATSTNIENPVICFKVEKSWMKDKGIDQSSIILNRYSDKKWNPLTTKQSGDDEKYLYFTAETPGFSPFAITGKSTKETVTDILPEPGTQDPEQNENTTSEVEHTSEQKEKTGIPGFEMIYCIIGLLGVFLYKRR